MAIAAYARRIWRHVLKINRITEVLFAGRAELVLSVRLIERQNFRCKVGLTKKKNVLFKVTIHFGCSQPLWLS